MAFKSGRHFLQIPGPTNIPERVLRAIDMPVIDHRGPDFGTLGRTVLDGIKAVFQTAGHVVIFPSSGTGAWEAGILNTLVAGDRVVMAETGQFSALWRAMAEKLKLQVDYVPGDWRHPADIAGIEARLAADTAHAIKAVMVVHSETSTGVLTRIGDMRAAMDRASHPALLMVDAVSSLGSIEYKHDSWRVDVTVAGSQKGLMMPPGLGFNAISDKALAISQRGEGMPRSYWDWSDMVATNATGYFPFTPAINLLYGLREVLTMFQEEGLANVFARHARHAAATRAAVQAWGLDTVCQDPRDASDVVTAVFLPEGYDADLFRAGVLDQYDMSLGTGLAKLKGRAFRIGHLGHFNDLMLMGALSGVEMGLHDFGVPHHRGGVLAAMDVLANRNPVSAALAA
jgi:alanine-glyoxylate transaminase / serine-glyoxylate transaminase / serine-pyruvate transaminase